MAWRFEKEDSVVAVACGIYETNIASSLSLYGHLWSGVWAQHAFAYEVQHALGSCSEWRNVFTNIPTKVHPSVSVGNVHATRLHACLHVGG